MIESPVLKELETEWKALGRAEGEIETKANSVRRVLRTRFGELPEAVDAGILAKREQSDLDRLLDLAALCDSLEEFQAQLP